MPFIGKTPEAGAFRLIDSITTSATDTYALTVLGDHYFPESARNLIVSLNGVTQAPETAYTVSGSHIVFASALTANDVIDYILVIGDAVDIGTPSDGTVGNAQLKANLDLSGKTLTFDNDQISGDYVHGGTISNFASTGIDDNATSTAITIDADENVAVGHASPVSLGAGYKNVDIRYTTGGGVTLGDTSNIHAYLFSDNNGVTLQAPNSRSIKFTTGSTTAITIDSSQRVGIGTANPLQLLHISKASADNYIRLGSNGANDAGIYFNTSADWTIGTDTSNSNAFDLSNSSTVGGASKVVVTTGGNVGIGTTSPNRRLQIGDHSGAQEALSIQASTTGKSDIFLGDGTGASEYAGLVRYDHASDFMAFWTASSESARINSSGNLLVGTTDGAFINGGGIKIANATAARLKLCDSNSAGTGSADGFELTQSGTAAYIYQNENDFMAFGTNATERMRILSSGGITFNGDTAAANALDDYEEGTHTCTVTMGSGSCSLYSNYDKIKYTKIGDLVTIQGQIRVESVSSPSGEMRVSMPFSINTTADEGSNISGSVVRTYLGNAPTGGLFLHGTMVFNQGNQCVVQWSKSGSATVNHVPTAGEYLVFNFSYKVA